MRFPYSNFRSPLGYRLPPGFSLSRLFSTSSSSVTEGYSTAPDPGWSVQANPLRSSEVFGDAGGDADFRVGTVPDGDAGRATYAARPSLRGRPMPLVRLTAPALDSQLYFEIDNLTQKSRTVRHLQNLPFVRLDGIIHDQFSFALLLAELAEEPCFRLQK